jgi:DNA-binding NarL/FixJ family response regulator
LDEDLANFVVVTHNVATMSDSRKEKVMETELRRLMIVADHKIVAEQIDLSVKHVAGLRRVGFFDGRCPMREVLAKVTPDVILVDDMPNSEDTLARIREATEELPGAKTILLSVDKGSEWYAQVRKAGAYAAISKGVHPASLGVVLREVLEGTVTMFWDEGRQAPSIADSPLTAREFEILSYVARGYTNARIARELWVTKQTVKFHLYNTYRKLEVSNRTEATCWLFAFLMGFDLRSTSVAELPRRIMARAAIPERSQTTEAAVEELSAARAA